MTWKIEYSKICDNIKVSGYSATENDSRSYFSNHLSSKLAEADSGEQLRTHLSELETTGFDTSILITQIESAPQVRDWEVGEAFAETVLEDEHEAMFPWETGWDKRKRKASLPGPDIVGLQNKTSPRFIFGQVKSTSEQRVPPQVVNSGKDCLKEQMYFLCHSMAERIQLIQWLLPRVKGTDWESPFNEALGKYAQNDYYLVGVLVSGGRSTDENDLTGICADLQHDIDDGELSLFGYYVPFDKKEWIELTQSTEVTQ
jgi:hypothetical protein